MLSVVGLVDLGLDLLIIAVAVATSFSILRVDPRNLLVRLARAIADPIIYPISAILPSTGKIDFGPVITLMILWAIQHLLH